MIERHQQRVNILWIMILLIVPLPPVAAWNMKFPNVSSWSLAVNSGILAYVWLLATVVLATKNRWIEEKIGLPDMYLVHGGIGSFALLSMHLHAFMLNSDGFTKQSGTSALYLFTFLCLYAVLFLGGLLASKVSYWKQLKRKLEKVFRHEISVWIHRGNLLVLLSVYLHMISITYIRTSGFLFALLTLYTAVTAGMYLRFLVQRRRELCPAKVKHISLIDATITELTIEYESEREFRAGDFVFLSFPDIPSLREPHPFSIGNDPKGRELVFRIDAVGDFTKKLATIEAGSRVFLSRGYGILHKIMESSSPKDKFVFLAGGVGAVPLMGLAETFDNRDILFLYTVQRQKSLLCEEMFRTWSKRENFRCILQKGRFTQDQCEQLIPLGQEYIYLIAGTPEMNLAYRSWLKKKGVSSKRIYFEGFYF